MKTKNEHHLLLGLLLAAVMLIAVGGYLYVKDTSRTPAGTTTRFSDNFNSSETTKISTADMQAEFTLLISSYNDKVDQVNIILSNTNSIEDFQAQDDLSSVITQMGNIKAEMQQLELDQDSENYQDRLIVINQINGYELLLKGIRQQDPDQLRVARSMIESTTQAEVE